MATGEVPHFSLDWANFHFTWYDSYVRPVKRLTCCSASNFCTPIQFHITAFDELCFHSLSHRSNSQSVWYGWIIFGLKMIKYFRYLNIDTIKNHSQISSIFRSSTFYPSGVPEMWFNPDCNSPMSAFTQSGALRHIEISKAAEKSGLQSNSIYSSAELIHISIALSNNTNMIIFYSTIPSLRLQNL